MVNPDSKTHIGQCPRNGKYYENQCARCGSSLMFEHCDDCGGEGVSGHDCGEDTCCCADPDDNMDCDWCEGEGGHWRCLSSSDWCQSHPIEGRETVASGIPEWFEVSR